ncbi:Oidioi.mRNA.OKI2018_I69.PAR.g10825.t1.cds [Oikopleura dioica]|uniref:Oidioi.mRNA.OKI2018_I69.PAR.g10825.t1.cds n=1 Tax=Oikopleura dioica TaxID=34765 RepID=A0ABN7RWV9_OIKDI|nr:Oidioi.mRNA.OKI2018_I69.PAR.g10825.t1.cds [Oikopleura dioica]
MCFSDSSGNSCMTFDGQTARELGKKSRFNHQFGSLCEKNGVVYGGGGREDVNTIEFYIGDQWHYNPAYDNPAGFRESTCLTVPEGILYFGYPKTYLFNTESLTWKSTGDAWVYGAKIRFVNNQIWSYQGYYNNYNLRLYWDGDRVTEGDRKMLPIGYEAPKPVILDEDEFALIE